MQKPYQETLPANAEAQQTLNPITDAMVSPEEFAQEMVDAPAYDAIYPAPYDLAD